MATEFSLLTWSGTGKTVTFTDAGDIVNYTAHGAPNGHAFRFTTTGALPTGLSVGTTYYLRQGADVNKFLVYPTYADAIAGTNQVTFTGTGSGTNQVVGEYWAALGSTARARYGTAGSERVYLSMAAFTTAIAAATADYSKTVVLEIEGKWDDGTVTSLITAKWYALRIETKIDGVRSSAWHGGVIGGGYRLTSSNASANGMQSQNYNTIFDGFEILSTHASPAGAGLRTSGANSTIRNCIIKFGIGCFATAAGCSFYNNICYGCYTNGFQIYASFTADPALVYNNIAAKCAVGFYGTNAGASVVNNIAIGNTTANWGTAPTLSFMDKNAGISTDTIWGTNDITLAADGSDFTDYANNIFTPASSASPQVNSGVDLADLSPSDIKDLFRPDYESATYPNNLRDVGAYEYDHGEGNIPPNYQDFTISGLISGSRVKIKKTSDGTVIYNDVVNATSLVVSYNAGTSNTPVTIDIAKGAAAPYYYRYRTTATISYLAASGVSVSQIPDIAADTYPAGVATDWAVNTSTKVISNASGTTVYTVQNLYSWLCDYYDHADRVDLDMPMYGITPEVFGLQNSGSISDADMELLSGGSIMDGTTLWANVYTVGTQEASTPIYIHVDGTLYTSFWGNGNIDVLLKFIAWDGTEVVDIRAHKFSDTYDHWQMTVGEGRNVAAIATSNDPDNQTAEGTVNAAPYTSITVTVDNPTGKQIDASDTAADYTTTIDGAGLTVLQIYERLKYLTKNPSTYVSANASFPEVKTSPYGTFAGGVFIGAQGIWLENVAAGDALNYILTDNAGGQHQAAAPPVQISVTGIVAGSAIQIYDVTNSTQLDVDVVAGTTYSLEKAWTGDLTIRVRLMAPVGATAYEFYEVNGVFTSAGMSMLAAQVLDTVYNINAIDGSAVTDVEIIDGTLRVQVATGSISWQTLYAYETYWLSTPAGIVDEGRFTVAIDVANYLWYNFKLKNVTSPSVPLIVTGGYGKDGDTGTSLAMIDTTGGTIILAPDHVVPYSSGAEATVAIVQAGLTAQGFTTSRAPKIDNLDIPVSEAGGGAAPTKEEIRAEIDANSTKLKFIKNQVV